MNELISKIKELKAAGKNEFEVKYILFPPKNDNSRASTITDEGRKAIREVYGAYLKFDVASFNRDVRNNCLMGGSAFSDPDVVYDRYVLDGYIMPSREEFVVCLYTAKKKCA